MKRFLISFLLTAGILHAQTHVNSAGTSIIGALQGSGGGTTVTYKGTWSSASTYAVGDTVTYNGSSYISLTAANTNHNPATATSNWSLLAAAGSNGTAGPPVTFRGTWASGSAYAVGDAVNYTDASGNTSSYISLQASNSGNTPAVGGTSYWGVLAAGVSGGLTLAQMGSQVLSNQVYATRTAYNLVNSANTWNGTSPASPSNSMIVSGRLGSNGALQYGPYGYAVNAFPGQAVTGFLPVLGQSNITTNLSSDAGYACFYDSNNVLIAGSCSQFAGSPTTLTVPSGAAFYRQTFNNSNALNLTGLMVVPGSTIPASFVGFGQVDSATMTTAINTAVNGTVTTKITNAQLTDITLARSIQNAVVNLFDKSQAVAGTCIQTSNGVLGGPSDHTATGYITVFGLPTIVSNAASNDTNSSYGYAFYDGSKTFIAGSSGTTGAGGVITVPTGAYYYRQCFSSAMLNTMVVAGSSVPSTYIAFGSLDSATAENTIQSDLNGNRRGANNYLPTYACTGNACTASLSTGRQLRVGVWGDSISSIFGQRWQNVMLARTGGTIVYQDARPGRSFDNSLECYGVSGMNSWSTTTYVPGNYDQTQGATVNGGPACGATGNNIGYQNGQSLAANIANVDVMVVFLGTNDESMAPASIGTLGDTPSAGTFYGHMTGLINALQTANPSMRILMVTNQLNSQGTAAQDKAIADAEVAFGASMGIPVLDLNNEGGVNSLNNSALLRDGIHPSNLGFDKFVGPLIAQFVLNHI